MYKAVVIGASAGGIRAVQKILSSLRRDFPLPIAIVLHLGPDSSSLLANSFSSSTGLSVKEVEDKEPIQVGTVYVAPPNYHFLVENDRTASLSVDEKECYSRPSIDVLFASAADAYGPELIGIVLTGASQDGARGARAIKDRGGCVIVERPETAEAGTMPAAALKMTQTPNVFPIEKIGSFLNELVGSGARHEA